VKDNSLHREIIEEHVRSPVGNLKLTEFTHSASYQSDKTGNVCTLQLLEKKGEIVEVGFQVEGSALALATASVLSSIVKGMQTSEVQNLSLNIIAYLESAFEFDLPGDLSVYHSIRNYPERFDCALLAWRTLNKALINEFQKEPLR
jgi:nitrogen fixation NifU-like protein